MNRVRFPTSHHLTFESLHYKPFHYIGGMNHLADDHLMLDSVTWPGEPVATHRTVVTDIIMNGADVTSETLNIGISGGHRLLPSRSRGGGHFDYSPVNKLK